MFPAFIVFLPLSLVLMLTPSIFPQNHNPALPDKLASALAEQWRPTNSMAKCLSWFSLIKPKKLWSSVLLLCLAPQWHTLCKCTSCSRKDLSHMILPDPKSSRCYPENRAQQESRNMQWGFYGQNSDCPSKGIRVRTDGQSRVTSITEFSFCTLYFSFRGPYPLNKWISSLTTVPWRLILPYMPRIPGA